MVNDASSSNPKPQPDNVRPLPNKRQGLRRGIYLLPNLITTGALFSGFYSIISSMTGDIEQAAIAIVIAGFLDSLDGRIARLTNTQREFGVQNDSLSDLVAFGVAPALLMFSWVLDDLGKLGWFVAFLYMACAALRLARFNTAPDSKVFFGLASPGAAGTIAALAWVWHDNVQQAAGLEFALPFSILAAVLAVLMVSNIRYYSPKEFDFGGRVPFLFMVTIVFLFVVVAVYPPGMLLIIGVAYAASGPIGSLLRRRKRYPEAD